MKTLLILTLSCSTLLLLNACTAREVATGAAVGTAGYVIGKEAD
jgi:hypothetical protein